MVQINDLSFAYSKQGGLFDGFSLELTAGNIYGLLGQNGAGKSTLLKMISGLLAPKSGEIRISGKHSHERDPKLLQEIFLVPEEIYVPTMTSEQYEKYYSVFYPRFDQQSFQAYLQAFEVPVDKMLTQLSLGQKKKFLLAFGLATDTHLLVLDEPTNGLDIPSKSTFRKIVANAIHEERTFIVSTHQVKDIENLIDPILIMDSGKVVFNHTYEEISEALAFQRLKHLPAATELVYSEESFGTHFVVSRNTGQESHPNLELLFNAVINDSAKMDRAFEKLGQL
ncbi:ABC transporter ATP-binding protein [Marinoscillum furvescens]|uniref:ABC-2 type transport system ATP-binding protein n=1 Tax=Marinoscillum furvescens DSM 4134 TaxID=1122208 RepID=A0A3D9KY96_MARFU|nr:ABC transporter ATP-binding protein [Marinoscillum furvescens]RED94388.1 ABC-2 type transport system ATP-binding protein [Marinoscillum furvescens DSM 4134]